MVDSLTCLGHYGFVGGNYDDRHIGDAGTAGTHGRKGFVARCVEEGDLFPVGTEHLISADMLGDTSSFAGHHVGTPDKVEQFGLAVVDMAHDRNDWRAVNKVFGFVRFILLDGFLYFNAHEFHLMAEFFSNKGEGFRVETLVNGNEHAERHTGRNDIGNRHI